LVQSGSSTGLAAGESIDARFGDVYVLDLAQAAHLEISIHEELTKTITLWVPRSSVLAAFSLDNLLHGLVIKGSSPAGALVGACLRCLAETSSRMTASEMNSLGTGVVMLVAKAIMPVLEETEETAVATPLNSFVTIRRYIDRNLASTTLDAEMIAKTFGLSRASIYRLFAPVGGVASYIRNARLKRAYQEISAPELADQRIGQIAYRFGFTNVSTFNRLFLTAYGVSPGEARERSFKGAGIQLLKSKPTRNGSLATWLAHISRH